MAFTDKCWYINNNLQFVLISLVFKSTTTKQNVSKVSLFGIYPKCQEVSEFIKQQYLCDHLILQNSKKH